jgi:predicted TIM-barrel fold metal-dependent hydrolase
VIPMHTAIDYPVPERTVTEMLEAGVRAVRVWPPLYHGYLADTWALGPLWSALAEHCVPVLVAASDLGRYPDQPGHGFSARNLYDVCRSFPTLPVIVVRMNFSAVRVAVPLMRECPNLFAELSYFTTHRGVEFLSREVGAERLVFGSGLPWASPGPGIAAIQYALISDEERALIAGENLRGLLAARPGVVASQA